MTDAVKIGFGPWSAQAKGGLVVFCDEALKFGPATRKLLGSAADLVQRAAKSERFTGKAGSSLDLIHPEGLKVARLLVAGIGKRTELKDFVRLGGGVMGKLPTTASEATIVAELPDGPLDGKSVV